MVTSELRPAVTGTCFCHVMAPALSSFMIQLAVTPVPAPVAPTAMYPSSEVGVAYPLSWASPP